jgi:hypothetical protein
MQIADRESMLDDLEKQLSHPKRLVVSPDEWRIDAQPRGERIYDPKLFNPYDPTTFGYVAFGVVEEAHGLTGHMKV